jgi:hypothetical protein
MMGEDLVGAIQSVRLRVASGLFAGRLRGARACRLAPERNALRKGVRENQAYLIAQAITAVVQCLVVWLVVTVTNRKLDREWDEALERWKATDRYAAASLDGGDGDAFQAVGPTGSHNAALCP